MFYVDTETDRESIASDTAQETTLLTFNEAYDLVQEKETGPEKKQNNSQDSSYEDLSGGQGIYDYISS